MVSNERIMSDLKDLFFIQGIDKSEIQKLISNVFVYDNIYNSILNSNAILILTEWDEFKSIDFKKVVKKENFKIYDMRNLYNPEEMRKKKIKYFSIGR